MRLTRLAKPFNQQELARAVLQAAPTAAG
jgi:hypothetical protein